MQKAVVSLAFLLAASTCRADPWGIDADLCRRPEIHHHCNACCPTPMIGTLAELLIGFHQNVISPCDGPRSHFLPSSSQYTLDAMRQYGFFKGYVMGCDRLMRENNEEWVYQKGLNSAGQQMKLDPVR